MARPPIIAPTGRADDLRVAVDGTGDLDAEEMKVQADGERILAFGKHLALAGITSEDLYHVNAGAVFVTSTKVHRRTTKCNR